MNSYIDLVLIFVLLFHVFTHAFIQYSPSFSIEQSEKTIINKFIKTNSLVALHLTSWDDNK